MSAPVVMRYEGDGEFRAMSNYWASQCDRAFTIGEMYRLTEHYERSAKSHNHFFATIAGAHETMPDELLEEYPSADVLRKKALIRKGYRDERSIVCATKAEAERVAAFIKPMDEYAIVVAREAVVRIWTAQSQSRKAMGAKAFQESKQAVLDFIDDLLGVERGATAKSAGYRIEHEPSEQPAADNDAGTNLPGETSQAPSGDIPADVEPPVSVGGELNSAQGTTPETGADADSDRADALATTDGTVAPESSGEEEKVAGASDGAVLVPATELSVEDRTWLRDGARMLLATQPIPNDREAKDVLKRAVLGIRENTADAISAAARDKLREVAEHCLAVCKGEADLDVPLVARTALSTVAEITPAPVKTARTK